MGLKNRQTDTPRSNAGVSRTTTPPKPKSTDQPRSSLRSTKPLQPSAKSKQAAVVSLLLRPEGATIAAMMETTGWKSHSVRGFLTGVVRKRLKLKLGSEKSGKHRIYRIEGGGLRKTDSPRKAKSRAA
jgi:hypothetical protein